MDQASREIRGGYILIADGYVLRLHESEVNNSVGLVDYKFYCFNGEPQFLYVSESLDDHSNARISYLNLDWTFSTLGRDDFATFSNLPTKPKNYEQMLDICRELSKETSFLRVDLYEINSRIYFSELTFFPVADLLHLRILSMILK